MDWIKVSEHLPEKDEIVLAWDGEEIHEGFWYSGMEGDLDGLIIWSHYDYLPWKDVTHWMPLPQPPSE